MIETTAPSPTAGESAALARLRQGLDRLAAERTLPPVERWNPPDCGDIDMRIAEDGTWFYQGSPILRPALVKLFASILRRDGERYVLVTPVERVGIAVEDVPFLAVEMAVSGTGEGCEIAFRTNVDDLVQVGENHPVQFDTDEQGGLKPYVEIRNGLWARLTRPLAHDLAALMECDWVGSETGDGLDFYGIRAGGTFFPAVPARDVEGI